MCFPIYSNVCSKYYQSCENLFVNEIRDFAFGKHYKLIGFFKKTVISKKKQKKSIWKKELFLHAKKSIEKISNPRNDKEAWLIFKILMIMNALNGVWSDT